MRRSMQDGDIRDAAHDSRCSGFSPPWDDAGRRRKRSRSSGPAATLLIPVHRRRLDGRARFLPFGTRNIGIDPSDGTVYVMETNGIKKFDSSGAPQPFSDPSLGGATAIPSLGRWSGLRPLGYACVLGAALGVFVDFAVSSAIGQKDGSCPRVDSKGRRTSPKFPGVGMAVAPPRDGSLKGCGAPEESNFLIPEVSMTYTVPSLGSIPMVLMPNAGSGPARRAFAGELE